MISSPIHPSIIALSAIAALTLLESIALYNGINGQLFASVIGILGAIIGWYLNSAKSRSRNPNQTS